VRWTGVLFLLCSTLPAQQTPPAVFRSTTKLVQVSVVAQDQDGKPVSDLRREDFSVLDKGAPQEIRLFLSENAASPPAKPTAPGSFTNQVAAPEGSRRGYSVILFDNLNTGFEHTARARLKALEAFKAIPDGDRIALYSLWCQFQVIREFTTDRDSLLQQLHAFLPAAGAVCAGSVPVQDPLPANGRPSMADLIDPQAAIARARAAEDAARIASLQAGTITDQEMMMIADYLAGIPGRKNLIWIAQKFPLSPAALQRLMNAGVAIYPIDAIGSTIALESEKVAHAGPIRALARVTGGVAYVDRDDLDVAIRESLEDGRISYTLGFYEAGDSPPGPHRLAVKVDRPGVTLRYRGSYSLDPPRKPSANPVADLMQAMNRPADATAIAITASAALVKNRLELAAKLDPSNLDLESEGALWKGKVEMVARFTAVDGTQAGDVFAETVAFNLRPATYQSMLSSGFVYRRELKIPAKAVELKILLGNLATGKIGTLTVPVSEIKGTQAIR
jgi:VWFA-related protein